MIIDAHQHFWTYDPVRHDWINEEMKMIRRDFQPVDLVKVYSANHIDACIAVQAEQSEEETATLLRHAAAYPFIAGVVGWVDLRQDSLEERLSYYSGFPRLKGFRHVLQNEEPSFLLDRDFLQGIGKLKKYGYTYDILIYPHHLPAAIEMTAQFPTQPFVIDHIAKPLIKNKEIGDWKRQLKQLAGHENMFCKISGMVTEADWKNWKEEDLWPYLDAVVEIFGPDRLMFGSDWPVCLVASSYERWLKLVKDYFSRFSNQEQEKVFAKNASSFYKLDLFN